MSFDTFAGNFALNTVLGNQSVIGVGFLPKIVFFYPTIQTADGVVADAHLSVGAAISSTSRFAMTANSEDAQPTSDAQHELSTSSCILVNDVGTGTTDYEADFVSQDVDGFTIEITNAPGSAQRVGFMALGGDDLTNVFIGNTAMNTVTGNQSFTGVGSQSDAIMFFMNKRTSSGSSSHLHQSIGFAVSPTKRGSLASFSRNGQATSDTARYQVTDKCIVGLSNSGSIFLEADFVSFDADGFTLDIVDAPSTADLLFYVALRGGQYDVGSFTTETSIGEFSITGVGFTPSGLFLSSFLNSASAVVVGDNEISLGVVSSPTERFATGVSDEDGEVTTDADSYSNDARVYLNYDLNQALQGDIDFTSFDADGFTLDQIDADPIANQGIYFAVGDASSTRRVYITRI